MKIKIRIIDELEGLTPHEEAGGGPAELAVDWMQIN
jgi:hypothetical protein